MAQHSVIASLVRTVCHHADGIAIGALVCELLERGVLHFLEKCPVAVNVNSLAHGFGARSAYFHVAMRLLAHQGFVRLSGDIPAGETEVQLTDQGMEWLRLADHYRQVPHVTELAASMLDVLRSGKGGDIRSWRLPHVPAGSHSDPLSRRVALHLYGWLVAAAMKGLSARGILNDMVSGTTACTAHPDSGLEPRLFELVREILCFQGWGELTSADLVLTAEGRVAASFAVQYDYPVSYLPTFRAIPRLLFGTGDAALSVPRGRDETHVDRLLDVQCSAKVFEHRCKEPFLEMVLPLFDREPVSEQPSCIVDTGSGGGTLLLVLHKAICERTLRGRMLKAHPLKLVGAEYTRIALETTRQAIETLGDTHLVTFGDIADPAGLSRKMAEHGIDPLNALHVNKSVIHNRPFKPPENIHRRDQWQPISHVPFVSKAGELIPARDMECNLVELFHAWRPFTGKHGMVTIEAHTVDPTIVSERVGTNMVTLLDATHGLSHQYPVEYEVFLRAIRAAGYHCRARRLLGGWPPDHPTLAVYHLVQEDRV